METKSEGRTSCEEEYLDLLRSLTREIDGAVFAITRNHLAELEESIGRQEYLAWQLELSVGDGGADGKASCMASWPGQDLCLAQEIRDAQQRLQQSSQVYGAVLQHAGRAGRLMLSLFDSRRGNLQEASGARRAHQTWSGQM